MPREVSVWQRTRFDDGYEICPHCNGWGGRESSTCTAFADRDTNWLTCFLCFNEGQVLPKDVERFREYLQ